MPEVLSMQPVDENDPSNWDIIKATQFGIFNLITIFQFLIAVF